MELRHDLILGIRTPQGKQILFYIHKKGHVTKNNWTYESLGHPIGVTKMATYSMIYQSMYNMIY